MGLRPLARVPLPPSREDFNILLAREAYVRDELTLEEFEESVGHVLAGGDLTTAGRILEPGGLPAPARILELMVYNSTWPVIVKGELR